MISLSYSTTFYHPRGTLVGNDRSGELGPRLQVTWGTSVSSKGYTRRGTIIPIRSYPSFPCTVIGPLVSYSIG